MPKLTVKDLPLAGKKVLIRVDYNVPLGKDGTIADETRIKESLPTIQKALQDGAAVILMSHLGRPKGGPDPAFSLRPAAEVRIRGLEPDRRNLGRPGLVEPDHHIVQIDQSALVVRRDPLRSRHSRESGNPRQRRQVGLPPFLCPPKRASRRRVARG